MKPAISQLHDIQDWFEGVSCAPTALAAVSGKTLSEIGILLQQTANSQDQISGGLLATYDLKDTLKAVKLLGSFWLAADTFDTMPFEDRPTIEDWIARNSSSGIQLVFCDDGGSDGHIFAVHENHVIDTYTHGTSIDFSAVPPAYRKFRVKLTFLILVGANPR